MSDPTPPDDEADGATDTPKDNVTDITKYQGYGGYQSGGYQPSQFSYQIYNNGARYQSAQYVHINGQTFQYDNATDTYTDMRGNTYTGGLVAALLTNVSTGVTNSVTALNNMQYTLQGILNQGVLTSGLGMTKQPLPEYSDRGFYTQAVRGLRTFKVTDDELTGVFYQQVWTPGENVAVCYKVPPSRWQPSGSINEEEHGMDTCRHGFYAFYDGSNSFRFDGQVTAMIEGYGTVLIGSRGFRASKAKIVAICLNLAPPKPYYTIDRDGYLDTSERLYYDHVTTDQAKAIRAKFPDVPMFDTPDKMIAEYPCVGMDESEYLDPKHEEEDGEKP